MTTTLKYVGKKSPYVGQTLWEILGNLKDFGIGRIIVRNSQASRYSEPCYLRVLEVTAQPSKVPPKIQVFRPPNDLRDKDRPRQVAVVCEYIFRGIKFDQPRSILSGESSVPDYSLIPKHLEKNYTFTKTSSQRREENILPRYLEFPPLFKDILTRSGVKEPKLTVQGTQSPESLYRIAKEGEQPTRQYDSGFGTPKSPNLYKGVNYDI